MTSTTSFGSTFGSILLITGCCIGAGMLGMPVITATAGFIPSAIAMLFCCAFMITTGLLLLEATLWFGDKVNLITLSRYALGTLGQILTWGSFVFLFYCLCVAYAIGCGDLLKPLFEPFISTGYAMTAGTLVSLTAVGVLIVAGTKVVDYFNRMLMIGLVAAYFLLVGFGLVHVDVNNFSFIDWKAAVGSVPLLLISFGYQNLIPSMTHYLKRNVRLIRLSIFLGITLTYFIYVIWEFVILGILPSTGESFEAVMNKGEMVTDALMRVTGAPYILYFAQVFAFFAIATSLLANSLTCLDFLDDGLKHYHITPSRVVLALMVLIPPFLISQYNHQLFLKALSIAGGTATVFLFGILPALVVWIGRYRDNKPSVVIGGGKPLLVAVMLISFIVLSLEIAYQVGFKF